MHLATVVRKEVTIESTSTYKKYHQMTAEQKIQLYQATMTNQQIVYIIGIKNRACKDHVYRDDVTDHLL